ncbi:MAG: membrane protein insertase YidC [Bacteroidia bacterium]|nr:membrane protein insertase YidC [Bacteroidia bacterium]
MDRNSYIGLGLIFLLLVGYFYINKPSDKDLVLQKHYADSIENVKKLNNQLAEIQKEKNKLYKDSIAKAVLNDSNALKGMYGGFASQALGQETNTFLENKDVKLTISNKGASIRQVQLKKFKTDSRQPVLLLDEKHLDNFIRFKGGNTEVKSDEFFWTLTQKTSNSLTFRLNDGNSYIEYIYTIADSGYNVAQTIRTTGMASKLDPKGINLYFNNDLRLQERDIQEEKRKSTLYFKYFDETADYISETSNEKQTLENPTEWVSFKQQFFNTTIQAKEKFQKGSVLETADPISNKNIKRLNAELKLPFKTGADQAIELNYFFGPNQYTLLKEQNIGLDKIIPLGWGIFGWINRFMIIPIFNFLNSFLGNYGVIILLLTLIIKTLLLPLVFKSYKSTAKMRLLKPEMDEIKERNKDNMQQQQVENMALYKKAGVNPLGGCLPMLLQMPILVAVFQFVPSAFEFRQESFLWADDLSIYDSIWTFGKLPIIDTIYGDHVSLFTLLMTISTLIYTKMNNDLTAGVNEQMKYISYLMPIMFLGFFNRYAAALTYYYFLSNVVTFTQQWAIRKFVDEDKLKAQIHEAKSKNTGTANKSAFQKRLEDMAKNGNNFNQNKKK